MAWLQHRCGCRARMRARVGRATVWVVGTAHGLVRAASRAVRVKVRLKVLAKGRHRVKAAVARRGRLNNPDKLKSAVAAMTRQHRQCRLRQPPRQVLKTTFSPT